MSNIFSQIRQRRGLLNEAGTDLGEDDFSFKDPTDSGKKPGAPEDKKDDDPPADDPKPEDDNTEGDPPPEEKPEDNPDDNSDDIGEDDFSMDTGDDEDSTDDNPDDETGNTEDNDGDNPDNPVNKLILNISGLDRALAEKRILINYMDLISIVTMMREKLEHIKINKDEAVVNCIIENLDVVENTIGDYIQHKIRINSLEENCRNFVIASHKVNSIMDMFKDDSTTNSNQ